MHVKLLNPCFKTGQLEPFRHRSWTNREPQKNFWSKWKHTHLLT